MDISILHPKEEKETMKLFHIKIWVNKSKINALFYFGSHKNLIAKDLIKNIVL